MVEIPFSQKYVRRDAADIHTKLPEPDETPGIPNHGRKTPIASFI